MPKDNVTEMYICETKHLFLHVDQLYIFRVHPECDECKALALHTPPSIQQEADADQNEWEVAWELHAADRCDRSTCIICEEIGEGN